MTPSSQDQDAKSRIHSLKKTLSNKHTLIDLLDSIPRLGKPYALLIKAFNFIKVFIASTRKFMTDDCMTKASAIAYTVIVSLVPTLTVILTFYSIFTGAGDRKDELFGRIQSLMMEHNIRLNLDPIFAALSNLIENAGKVGGIGAAVLVFSATTMLRSLEQYLNDIWKVTAKRAIYLKIVYYWSALTLGPLVLVAGTTAATTVAEALSAPRYNSMASAADNELWVVGGKSTILHGAPGAIPDQRLPLNAIDFDNQRRFSYDAKTGSFTELDIREGRIEALDFKNIMYRDIQFIENRGWIVGQDGILLRTIDNGRNWQLRQWGTFTFHDICMLDAERGFIAADSGRLLSTENGGRNWLVREWPGITGDLRSIEFMGKTGIVTANGGSILLTRDGGLTWEVQSLEQVKSTSKYCTLNGVFFQDENTVWIVGSGGILLKSIDAGATWKLKKFRENDYYSVRFIDEKVGFAAGDSGTIISTTNGGRRWRAGSIADANVLKLYTTGKTIWALGENGLLMHAQVDTPAWKGESGGSFLKGFLNFATPFSFIWIFFLLAYMTLPNTRVSFKSAALGSAFTSAIWVIFLLLFIVYVRGFAKGTFAVYGALAAFPLFLLLVYTSAVIMLFGGEVSFTIMHPETYASLRRIFERRIDMKVYHGIFILYSIYNRFETGNGESSLKELTKEAEVPTDLVKKYLELFEEEKLVLRNPDDSFLPSNSSANIKVADVMDAIYNLSLEIPGAAPENPVKEKLEALFKGLQEQRREVMAKMTLRDFMVN